MDEKELKEAQKNLEGLAKIERDLKQSRDEKFKVVIELESDTWQLYPDEAHVSLTYNGYRWHRFNLNEREARLLVVALKKHFGRIVE